MRVIEPPHALQVFAVGTGATNLIYRDAVPFRFTPPWPRQLQLSLCRIAQSAASLAAADHDSTENMP
ncbi:hypothetical protein SKA53_09819 [Yoonia vestfoldensis SKA53]|uniref:Uncharacterized protein n=1 Tax=Yoonia vestfoldensis SKA53 TaxID=314232 RepID=A3V1C6_9RHOB|nr:hypothetical protein SKA53_09819 [Yoonia vestfoldensis SKA53]